MNETVTRGTPGLPGRQRVLIHNILSRPGSLASAWMWLCQRTPARTLRWK